LLRVMVFVLVVVAMATLLGLFVSLCLVWESAHGSGGGRKAGTGSVHCLI
jgi:hypothetical protein